MADTLQLTILGTHAGTPRSDTHPTAQVLQLRSHTFLIDCGEGTQQQLRRYRISFSRIEHVFISHLHGDHFFGLIGLISSMNLLGRTKPLTIYAPKGLKEVIDLQLKVSETWLSFPIVHRPLWGEGTALVFEDAKLKVTTIPLKHRIYARGFLFQEYDRERKLNVEAAHEARIDTAYFRKLKQGADVPNRDNVLVKNGTVTWDPPPPKSYAYCSDTLYKPALSRQLQGVTVLYHEATFLEEHAHLTKKTMHSTAKEAANLAKASDAGTLILGHFSTRYKDREAFREEARTVFPNVLLAKAGETFSF